MRRQDREISGLFVPVVTTSLKVVAIVVNSQKLNLWRAKAHSHGATATKLLV